MRQRRLLFGAVAALLLTSFAAGIYFSQRGHGRPAASRPDGASIEKLLATSFAEPSGRTTTLSHLRGKPLIVNFWATWCPPCLKEMPVFSRLQEKYPNVQFVGIAADTLGNVQLFVANRQLSYPVFVAADGAVLLMAELGNDRNGLPFTLSIDSEGRPRHSKLGALSETETERIIADLSNN